MADIVSWIATVATVIAASMTASNLGARFTGYGFCVFLIGSLSWLATGVLTEQPALVWTNIILTILNIFGIWRWLGRQVRIEEGASAAAERSECTAGETLFPVSLLLKAPVEEGGGTAIGTCVDAMAGCLSGNVRYVVVSEGGVAGVGEVLRRVPFERTQVEPDKVLVHHLEACQQITKDEWPAN